MSQSFDAHPYTIGHLLSEEERRGIYLPRFQRGFSWEKSHVATFWEDLNEFKNEYDANPVSASYFLGPITITTKEEEIILLDGQQRLATAVILLACIRDIARSKDTDEEHKGADLARDIQTKYIVKGDTDPLRYSLFLGELDEPYFLTTIKRDNGGECSATTRSHHLIRAAYDMLKTNIEREISGLSPDDAINRLRLYRNCLTKGMSMVGIDVSSEEDAYNIFETLNDRGLRLSVPDLVLNLLLQRGQDDNDRVNIRSKWNLLLQEMGKRDIARFLRHLWVSRYGDLKARGLYKEIKDHLLSQNILSLGFANRCAEECSKYISILDVDLNIPANAQKDVRGLVKYLNVPASFPVLLSGLVCLNQSDFAKLAHFVASLIVRHSIFADLNPAPLEEGFYEAARVIRSKKDAGSNSKACLTAAKRVLGKINPDDSTVHDGAKKIDLTRKQAVWIINRIAQQMQSGTGEIGIEQANLEHIFPLKAGADWPNRKDLDDYIWRLGNLTCLSKKLNERAGNKGFTAKCSDYYKRSELVITKNLTAYSQWTPTEVDERGEKLIENALALWPGP